MNIKRILMVSLMAGAMSLTGCFGKKGGGKSGGSQGPISFDVTLPAEALGTYDITIWGSETAGVKELFQQQVQDFCALNEGLTINLTYEEVSEANAASKVLADLDAAGDIYCFAQDQFADLVQGGALSKLGAGAAEAVKANNNAGSVAAVTSGTDLYAYPMTADNGYFMYYDTSVVQASHLSSLEDIVADCEAAGRNFAMETSTSAWYLASFFFGAGCVSSWETDETGAFVAANDTFNSDKGLIAMRGMQHLVKSANYVSSSNANSEFNAAIPAAVVVSGTWDYDNARNALGDKLGVAELPSYKVDGQSYHMGSYSGFKLMGVKPQTDVVRSRVLSTLAYYLTSEKCQEERFDTVSWGPSNNVVAGLAKVQANPALAALLKQSAYSTPQGAIPGAWWDFAKTLGTAAAEAALDDTAALNAALVAYAASVNEVIHPSEQAVWALVGNFSRDENNWWNAATAKRMTEGTGGVWTFEGALAEGDQFKVCTVNSTSVVDWTYGFDAVDAASTALDAFEDAGGNIGVKTAGTYRVTMTGTGVLLDTVA